MPKDRLTPKERWEAVVKGEMPDKVPTDWRGTGEMRQKVLDYFGFKSFNQVIERFHIDAPVGVGPKYVGPELPEDTDIHGVKYRWVDYGTGRYHEDIEHPLALYNSVEEIEANYTWPSIDWYDFSHIPEQVKGVEDRPIQGGGSEPFLTYKKLRGQEQAFMDLVLYPDIVHYCLDKLFDFCYENTQRIYEAIPGRVFASYIAEDLGSQTSLLMSREHLQAFLFPRMKRMMDLAHSAGVHVFHHDDGAIRPIIPDLIEMGMDVLDPVQWRCPGMETDGLKRDFGNNIAFHGAVDNQQTLPFGSAEDVKKEVEEHIRVLGKGGGLILAPCHNIQPLTPAENVIAMYDTAYEIGWYE